MLYPCWELMSSWWPLTRSHRNLPSSLSTAHITSYLASFPLPLTHSYLTVRIAQVILTLAAVPKEAGVRSYRFFSLLFLFRSHGNATTGAQGSWVAERNRTYSALGCQGSSSPSPNLYPNFIHSCAIFTSLYTTLSSSGCSATRSRRVVATWRAHTSSSTSCYSCSSSVVILEPYFWLLYVFFFPLANACTFWFSLYSYGA